jgi:tetratricopeptide (TPR) repeat protein
MDAMVEVRLALTEQSKVVVAEASYIMGDSDTIMSAEENTLMKAKRKAIEEAGVYMEASSRNVETYTAGHTSHINSLGIRTLAAAVTETEILEKRRWLEGDRLVFYLKIKAAVHLDWLAEAIKRMKTDEQLAAHHRQLQTENSQLKAELERLRNQSTKADGQPKEHSQTNRNRTAAQELTRTAIQTRSLPAKIDAATRAIAKDDSYADAYIVRGQTYLRIASLSSSATNPRSEEMNSYVEHAIEDFDRALNLDPTSTWALLGRGDAYTWQSKMPLAAKDYRLILKLDPLFDMAQHRLIALNTSIAKKQVAAKQWQAALETLGQILRPDTAPSWIIYEREAYLLRSHIYTDLGELGRAIEDLSTILRVDPTNSQALLQRAELHRRLLQGRLAKEDFERACELAIEEACASLHQ